MRHNKAGTSLGRFSAHRKALMQNLAVALFEHEVIRTTLPKAKELRKVAEPLITRAKSDSVANRDSAARADCAGGTLSHAAPHTPPMLRRARGSTCRHPVSRSTSSPLK